MADERIEQRESPASLVALRNELALPQNKELYDYGIQGRNFEECLARIAHKLGIALDGLYDVPELCDVLLTVLRRKSVLKVIGENGFVDGDASQLDDRLIGIRRIEDADTVRLENRDLILPRGVKRGELETAVAKATKTLSHPDRVSDGSFIKILKDASSGTEPGESGSDTSDEGT